MIGFLVTFFGWFGDLFSPLFDWFEERRHNRETREFLGRMEYNRLLHKELVAGFERDFGSASTPLERAVILRTAHRKDLVPEMYAPYQDLHPDIKTWAEKYEQSVGGARRFLEQANEFLFLIDELGIDAIDYGPHRHDLQQLQSDITDYSEDSVFHDFGDYFHDAESLDEVRQHLGPRMEFAQRILDGEFPEDILNDFEYRAVLQKRARAAQQKEVQEVEEPQRQQDGFITIEEVSQLPPPTYNRPPKVDEMTVHIERGGTLFRLYLNFSQQERAVIRGYGLDELVIEQEPIYSRQQIADMKATYDAAIAKETDNKRKQTMRTTYGEQLRLAQSQVVTRYIRDFLLYPYERHFATALEVTEYSDKLRSALKQFQAKLITYLQQSESENVKFTAPAPAPRRADSDHEDNGEDEEE